MTPLKETTIGLATDDGTMEVFQVRPAQDDRAYPHVILYMDVWGIREELNDIARRIAGEGYCVLVPDLYYRQGKIRFGERDANGRMMSLDRIDEKKRGEILGVMRSLSDAMVVSDTKALLRHAAENSKGKSAAAIGYCMGGRHAIVVAEAYSEVIRATVSLHGSNLVTAQPSSPHLGASRIRGEVYCGFAEKDSFATPHIIAQMAEAFADQPAVYHSAVHPGAAHGYALPDRDVYDEAATERDFSAIFALFARQMQA